MTTNRISRWVKHRVSADKNRYQKDGYDLDLTYITDRIIGMSFPSDGSLEKTFRNDINEVAHLLQRKHPGRFVIYNLCAERCYDYEKFDNKVHTWCGWPDHHSPPLVLLFKICQSIHEWLRSDPEGRSVAIVHCLAGKGRTGTAIAAYMIYAGLFNNGHDALHYFASRRSVNIWGVTNPGQVKAVQDFADIYLKRVVPSQKCLLLKEVVMNSIPVFDNRGCCPFLEIYSITRSSRIYCSLKDSAFGRKMEQPPSYTEEDHNVTFTVNRLIRGDVVVVLNHVTPIYRPEPVVLMLRLQFHTGLLKFNEDSGSSVRTITFPKPQLDDAYKDKRFDDSFSLRFVFTKPRKELRNSFEKEEAPYIQEEMAFFNGVPPAPLDGSIMFFPGTEEEIRDKIHTARNTASVVGSVEKSGYLSKLGHRRRNWKTRWFVLKKNNLSYFPKPRDLRPIGIIPTADIWTVVEKEDTYTDTINFITQVKPKHGGAVYGLVYINGHVWAGAGDGSITIWNVKDRKVINTFQAHKKDKAIHGIAVAMLHQPFIITSGEDAAIHIWTEEGTHFKTLKEKTRKENSRSDLLICEPVEGKLYLYAGDSNGLIVIWDLNTLKFKGSIKLDIGIGCLAVHGTHVWVGLGRYIYSFVANEWKKRGVSWKAHEETVNKMVVVGDEMWSCGDDKSINVWDAKSPESRTRLKALKGHRDRILHMCVVNDHVWSSDLSSTMITWSTSNYKTVQEVKGRYTDCVLSMIKVSKGEVWTGLTDKQISLWGYKKDVMNCFELITKDNRFLMQAGNEEDRRDWIEAIELARYKINSETNLKQEQQAQEPLTLNVRVLALRNYAPTQPLYCILSIGKKQQYRTNCALKDSSSEEEEEKEKEKEKEGKEEDVSDEKISNTCKEEPILTSTIDSDPLSITKQKLDDDDDDDDSIITFRWRGDEISFVVIDTQRERDSLHVMLLEESEGFAHDRQIAQTVIPLCTLTEGNHKQEWLPLDFLSTTIAKSVSPPNLLLSLSFGKDVILENENVEKVKEESSGEEELCENEENGGFEKL